MVVYRCVRGVHTARIVCRNRIKTRGPGQVRLSIGDDNEGTISRTRRGQQKSDSLNTHDINTITSSFLARTQELEPDMELKELSKIREQFQERYNTRYLGPSKQWARTHGGIVRSRYLINEEAPHIRKQDMQFRLDELSQRPLNKGDLVLLKQHINELSMCIGVPESTSDPRYTFVTVDGTLKFCGRGSVLLRIPHELPSTKDIELVIKEKSHKFDPIGTVKNSSSETFILPTVARQSLTSHLPQQISKVAWNQLPVVLVCMEKLHRSIQNFNGPIAYPFVKLVRQVQEEMKIENGENTMDCTIFLATYWALQLQQKMHMWGDIQQNKALLTPVSVTVLPFDSQHIFYTELKAKLKSNNYQEIEEFGNLINKGDIKNLEKGFPDIIRLLKDYASGNLQCNESIISLLAKIFRNIDKYKDMDITRDCCHELLLKILRGKSDSNWNPILENYTLGLPSSSEFAHAQQIFFDNVKILSNSKVSSSSTRVDFGDMNVYCIDSEDAHEIDDGISIKDNGNNTFTLYVHIADPASFFNESNSSDISGIQDEVLKIASQKCFTTYLPDIVVPMLPKNYCQAADLGKNGKKTKTITFSVDVSVDPIKRTIEIVKKSFQIRLGLVSRFPKVSYQIVDSLLKTKDSTSTETKELKDLHQVATLLRKYRINKMDAVLFGDDFNKGLVQLSEDNKTISFIDRTESDSVVLVTEMMILANTLSGQYFHDKGIPGVFRSYQPLLIGSMAQHEFNLMKNNIKRGKLPTYKDITLLSSLLNSSFYSSKPSPHSMIGATQYLTVTSPLRRFPDLVNHLQIHRFVRGLPFCFEQSDISNLIANIQSRDSILKEASRKGASYWTLKYLKDSFKTNKDQKFDVMVTSVPQLGLVRCVLPEYPLIGGTLRLKLNETQFPVIGEMVRDCKITKIDCLDGILELDV